jgi:hypothetical protein
MAEIAIRPESGMLQFRVLLCPLAVGNDQGGTGRFSLDLQFTTDA